jgi:hypothetical protein
LNSLDAHGFVEEGAGKKLSGLDPSGLSRHASTVVNSGPFHVLTWASVAVPSLMADPVGPKPKLSDGRTR